MVGIAFDPRFRHARVFGTGATDMTGRAAGNALFAVTLLFCAAAGGSDTTLRCQSLRGTQQAMTLPQDACNSPIGLCTRGIIADGPLAGTIELVTHELVAGAGLVAAPFEGSTYRGTLTIRTAAGELEIDNIGVLKHARGTANPAVFSEVGEIVAGTGRFAGASGHLFFSGTSNATGDGFESRLTGSLCFEQ